MKCESTPNEEATVSMKLESLSPEHTGISDDDESMKLEPLSYEKGRRL